MKQLAGMWLVEDDRSSRWQGRLAALSQASLIAWSRVLSSEVSRFLYMDHGLYMLLVLPERMEPGQCDLNWVTNCNMMLKARETVTRCALRLDVLVNVVMSVPEASAKLSVNEVHGRAMRER